MQPHRINVPLVAKREVIHLLSYMSHLKLMQYEYMLILPLLINITVISSRVPYPKFDRKARSQKRKPAHAEILTGSLHKSQLESREAVTSKTHYKTASEAHQARTKKHKRKRSSTNSCTEPQGKDFKQIGNTANDDVNRATENLLCP